MGADRSDQPTLNRVGATLQAWTPGTVGGRFVNASPILYGENDQAAGAAGVAGSVVVAVDTASKGIFGYDTFTLASTTPTVTLAHIPVANSVHVYLNGVEQTETTDYTLTDDSLAVQTAMAALSGDVLHVRYAYVDDIPDDTEIG